MFPETSIHSSTQEINFVLQKPKGNYRVHKSPPSTTTAIHSTSTLSSFQTHFNQFNVTSSLSTGFHRGPYSSGSPATISQYFSLTKVVLDIWQEILSGTGAGLLSKQDHTV
jgi:hypothetical protein